MFFLYMKDDLGMVVYKHRKASDGSVFYIGIGDSKRPSCRRDRNNHWNNIVKKHGFEYEIVFAGLTKDQAVNAEKWLIGLYGRIDLKSGCLVNMTDGGDGVKSWIPDESWREKQSKAKKGKPRPEEVKIKISKTKTGVKRPDISGSNHHFYGLNNKILSVANSRRIRNTENNEFVVGVKSLSDMLGVKYSTLVSWLNGSNKKPEWVKWEYLNQK